MGRVWCEHGYSDDCPKCEAYAEAVGCVHQQRRYEIARDVIAQIACSDSWDMTWAKAAEASVKAADALLAALSHPDEPER